MIYTALLVAASAALASAQLAYNSTTGKFICPVDKPNGDFCAGDSLSTNIIIRCTNGVGQPGNCNDNLAGYFPFGVNYAPCWQTSNTTGDAACSKNCVVQCGSGGCGNGTIVLPGCTPTPSPSSSTASSTSSLSSSASSSLPTTGSTTITITSTGTTTCVTSGTTVTSTFTTTTTFCPTTTSSISTIYVPTSYTPLPTGGPTSKPSNGTVTTPPVSATRSPVGPTTTASTPAFTGAANAFAPGALAGAGLLIAYFL